MATAAQWFEGARPRTLPAALAPVAVGTGLATYAASAIPVRAALALVVAVALQVGVNYANDYSDGIKGTDAVRVGPFRLVGQGLAAPTRVRAAAFVSFGVAAVAGLALVLLTAAWWLLLVGLASIAAAWLYTGGPRPYGYAGLGEVFVLVFFGIVPVAGTAYVQVLAMHAVDAVAGLAVGLLACAILVANNLRDIPGDAAVGKRTLAVRLGESSTRLLYVGSLACAGLATIAVGLMSTPLAYLALLALLLGVPAVRTVMSGASGPALIAVLKQTGVLLLVYGLALGILLALG
ncbi:MAG: 1,4-dihydroxy-2-naphthoate polyprenyltransferase [Actinomycetota bacterium]|nr:1,4-dihydroxy-2-naphthoate polyprenyltransferase [Actinomycetota bacterium]